MLMEMKKKYQTVAFVNLVGSIVFILLGIWAWVQTMGFQYIANTYVQPSTFPRVMIVGLLIFSVVLLAQSAAKLLSMREGVGKADDALEKKAPSINPVKDKGVLAAFAVILLTVLFTALFKTLGYVICSVIVGLAIMYMIGKRSWGQMIAVAVLVPFGMFLIFYKLLTVNIPMGPLRFIRDLLDMI